MSAAAEPSAIAVTVRAPAKINLCLGVGPVRPDGFHPLDTVYQAISLYDDVTVVDSEEWSVSVEAVGEVDVREVPLDAGNIAVRAGALLAGHHGLARCAAISIAKGIPVAGGMAGGSADAAATLLALDRLWSLHTADEDLLALAAQLGSDVPFALVGGTARGLGRGEIVEPVEDRATWWWVVVPDAACLSTPSVYRGYDDLGVTGEPGPSARVVAAIASGDADALGAVLQNDLRAPALDLRPDLAATERELVAAGAAYTLLSGSGPTYLGLVRSQEQALRVRENLLDRGYRAVLAAGPVAGAHVVTYA